MSRFKIYQRLGSFEPDGDRDSVANAIEWLEDAARIGLTNNLFDYIIVDCGKEKPFRVENGKVVLAGYMRPQEKPIITKLFEFIKFAPPSESK